MTKWCTFRCKLTSILCTDGFSAYKQYADDNYSDITHIIIPPKHRKNGIYHINHVNSLHSSQKDFIARFKGVATKYLQNYLVWHNTLFGVKSLRTKSDKLTSSSIRTNIKVLWRDIKDRPAIPVMTKTT